MKDLFSIKGKVIIITGAGRSIGYKLATGLAKYSAKIYSLDKKFTKIIPKNLSSNIINIKCDITDHKKIKQVFKKIFTKEKKIDVLINNAGVSFALQNKNQLYSEKNWIQTINVNLTGSFYCSKEAVKFMLKQRNGSIINITSIHAELGFPRNPAYNASKGGLKLLGKAFAKDWSKFGIRVNSIGPGYIKTEMTSKRFANKKNRLERQNKTLLGRWGETDDLIGPCIFLASDASSYMTGQDLYIDGGWIINSGIS
jgi:NAD(P)-dependent dehydrogenase (short-subunit alcohol dehydrogenase family)|tara:strand:- start:66 stop:830 length:765 start_codon:yes stop_codon:yes gene_type:complete